MKLAVLSGKGGAGKTLVAVNLAVTAGKAAYVDCDAEEPNGRLFLKPTELNTTEVSTLLPEFDSGKCIGCRKCVEFCRFNALVFLRKKPMVFSEVCHSCGGCRLVCPAGAVSETACPVGVVEQGRRGDLKVFTGVLNVGEASGVPVIQAAQRAGLAAGEAFTVVDCPPGSACAVMESVEACDYCLLVAEPTAFGFHNFKMVYELAHLLGKPCGVVINKMDEPYEPLESFCEEHGIPVLLRIPFRRELAALAAQGRLVSQEDAAAARMFRELLEKLGGEAV